MTRASVLIPVHDKPTTLPLTVDTVLRQSVSDLEVILIGDGVTDDVRVVIGELIARDRRVRFLDFPKGPHHGERYRHDGVEAAESDAIFYLCDDDLLLPDHVADLLTLLEDHDLVQCLNGRLTASGEVRLYAGDLADPACVALHLDDQVRYNCVSITGTAHSRRAYRDLDDRWDTTPVGHWPDHWQFRKFMRRQGFRGATSTRMTALQFPTSSDGRDSWDDAARVAEIVPWHARVTAPGAQAEIDRLTRAGMLPHLIESRAEHARLAALAEKSHLTLSEISVTRDENAAALADLRAHLEDLRSHIAALSGVRGQREAQIERLRAKVRAKNATIARLRARVTRLRTTHPEG